MARSRKRPAKAAGTRTQARAREAPKAKGEADKKPPKEADPNEELLRLLRSGMAYQRAAGSTGISRETLRDWIRKGEAGHPDFVKFSQARDKGIGTHHLRVATGSKKDWRAAAWLLERIAPGEYGFKQQVAISLEQGVEKVLDAVEAELGGEAAARVYRRLAADSGGETAGAARSREPVH